MSNQRHFYGLFNSLFKQTANKTKRSALLAICKENSVMNAGFPLHRASNEEHGFRAMSSWSGYILHRQEKTSVPQNSSRKTSSFYFQSPNSLLVWINNSSTAQMWQQFPAPASQVCYTATEISVGIRDYTPVVYMDVINYPCLKSNVGLSNLCLEE